VPDGIFWKRGLKMSENMTPQEGSGALSVDQAAGALLGMMGGEDSQEQTETRPEAEQEVTETEEETVEASADDLEDEQEEGEEVEEKPKYRVKIAGEEAEVTLDELINGYQREADYTKKTQSLAEARKALENEKASVEQAKILRDQYAQRLGMIEQVLQAQSKPENLEELKETDPIGYAVKVAEQQQRDKQLQAIQSERNRIAQMQQTERVQTLSQHVAQEAEKLAQAIPEFRDPTKGETVRKEIRAFAKANGWTDQELSSVYDSRAVLTLYKAMKYEQMMSKQPQVTKRVSEAPKMLKSGVSSQRDPGQEQIKKQKQQLKRSGRVADAASVFERFI
jgi:hypothetical protein